MVREWDVKRHWFTPESTIGELHLDNSAFECFTLEDTVREIPGVPVTQWKVAGKTAIPAGRYRVVIDHSARFKCPMPHLLDVLGFVGIRIHILNSAEETEGCIGLGRVRKLNFIAASGLAFSHFLPKLEAALDAGTEVYLNVTNEPLEDSRIAPH